MDSMKNKHLILTGMMGTGKTTIGRLLAQELKLPFIDMDELLQQRFQMTVAEYFQRYGEAAFRREESQLLEEMLAGSTSVISTGGGAVLRTENRQLMKRYGYVIHLTAPPEVLYQRLSLDTTRPLLQGDLKQRIKQISDERAPFYRGADVQVATDREALTEIIQQIIALWQATKE